MAISPGTRLGNYEVIAPLGAGGMGEVYRATDLRLNRPVAVKILPADFAADADRVRRFEAEARAASALNHPHIVSIFETGRTDSVSFIAMELVEGLPLDQWVQRQRPGLERVLQVVAQTADALSAAHQAGIVHRDLKPANLIVTAQGYVKVVDFGLAKITTGSAHDGETQTVVGGHTTLGAVIGTAAYMSPEQALGRSVDSRTDIFSLGTILFEAATGRQPFSGASTLELLHAVVHDPQPRVRDIEPKSPPVLDWILAKALAKDPDERYQSMRELSIDVRHLLRALQGGRDESTPAVQPADTRPVWRRLATGAALFMTAAVAAWIGRAIARPAATETARPPVVTLAPLTSDPGYEGEATFSADGQTIAYVSDRTGNFEIFLRQVSGGPSINLTSNAADDVQPAFSPDGRQIAFVSSRSGTSDVLFTQPAVPLLGGDVWVMRALGGSPRRLAEKGNFPSWSRDGGSLLYTGGPWFGQRLYRVDASGGPPSEIPIEFPADRRVPGQLTYPREAPDGRWILLVGTPDDIYVVPAAGGTPTAIARGSMATWGPDGASIIYSNADVGRNDSLWRLPFDKASGRVGAPPEPLTIDRGSDLHPAMSADGRLVAFTASEVVSNIERIPFDPETGQTGPSEMVTAGKDPIYFFTSAPDGSAVAFALARGSGRNLWRSAADGTAQQLTWEPRVEDGGPRWSPDGRTILFSRRSTESGALPEIWTMDAEGGSPRRILGEIGLTGLFAWTFDGRGIVSVSPKDRQLYDTDLSTRNSRRLTQEPGVMPIIVTSRDGSWAVYQSVQSGDVDLYAVPLEGGGSRPVVATSHKEYHPMLSPSGRWLYYLRDHNAIYRVPGPSQGWRQASPEKVIDFRLPSGAFIEDPQITPDGRYLLYARGRFSGDLWLASLGR